MMFRLRRRSRAFRVLWAALLLLAVVLKPALVLASQAHESGHQVQSGHAHDDERGGVGIPSDEAGMGDVSDAWHALMHLGHCCTHPNALTATAPLLHTPALKAPVPQAHLSLQPSALRTRPLRPPILG